MFYLPEYANVRINSSFRHIEVGRNFFRRCNSLFQKLEHLFPMLCREYWEPARQIVPRLFSRFHRDLTWSVRFMKSLSENEGFGKCVQRSFLRQKAARHMQQHRTTKLCAEDARPRISLTRRPRPGSLGTGSYLRPFLNLTGLSLSVSILLSFKIWPSSVDNRLSHKQCGVLRTVSERICDCDSPREVTLVVTFVGKKRRTARTTSSEIRLMSIGSKDRHTVQCFSSVSTRSQRRANSDSVNANGRERDRRSLELSTAVRKDSVCASSIENCELPLVVRLEPYDLGEDLLLVENLSTTTGGVKLCCRYCHGGIPADFVGEERRSHHR